jgi:hypothetical protein
MHYVLLIHAAEARYAAMSPAETEALMQAHGEFSERLLATGRAGDSAALEPSTTATSVRVREGKRSVQDGPFAETREQLGGYYSLRAESEEEAIAWAAQIPDAQAGTVEVRPIPAMDLPPTPVVPGQAKIDPALCKEYLLLIYEDERIMERLHEAELGALYTRYLTFTQELIATGHYIAGEPLDTVKKAKSVSVRSGERVVRDGPFAETREQLGGYYRVYARDLDEACALAARIPGAETGTIEIRPVMDVSAYT